VKTNSGDSANPDNLKLNIDLTYGDHMQYEFTIEKPNKVKVHHYTGKNSLFDPHTYWGFSDESLSKLVEFFNRFEHGINISPDDLRFLDSDEDSYDHDKHDSQHLYTDDSNLRKFGNSTKESVYGFTKWISMNK
jgi:hypothetical protein